MCSHLSIGMEASTIAAVWMTECEVGTARVLQVLAHTRRYLRIQYRQLPIPSQSPSDQVDKPLTCRRHLPAPIGPLPVEGNRHGANGVELSARLSSTKAIRHQFSSSHKVRIKNTTLPAPLSTRKQNTPATSLSDQFPSAISHQPSAVNHQPSGINLQSSAIAMNASSSFPPLHCHSPLPFATPDNPHPPTHPLTHSSQNKKTIDFQLTLSLPPCLSLPR